MRPQVIHLASPLACVFHRCLETFVYLLRKLKKAVKQAIFNKQVVRSCAQVARVTPILFASQSVAGATSVTHQMAMATFLDK